MKKLRLYTIPFAVSGIFFILGLAAVCNLLYLPLVIDEFDGMGGGYALILIGGVFLITSFVIFFIYHKLERNFRNMMRGGALLQYRLPADMYRRFSASTAAGIKSGNLSTLILIIAFSVLFAIIFTAISKSAVFLLIFLGIDVFAAGAYILVTAFRTRKVRRSQALVLLSSGGSYVFGQMHAWNVMGGKLLDAGYADIARQDGPGTDGVILLSYFAPAYPAPRTEEVVLPVPPVYTEAARRAVEALRQANGL